MSSDWQNKRTMDAYLASIPYGLRQQMEADAKKGKKTPAAFAKSKMPKVKGKEFYEGEDWKSNLDALAKKAKITITPKFMKTIKNDKIVHGVINSLDHNDPRAVKVFKKWAESTIDLLGEATVTGSFMSMPRPMYQGSVSGTEDGGYEVKTSPGGRDSHIHTAYIDGFGNGYTSIDGEHPHTHTVTSFQVGPHQDPTGMNSHEHIGELSAPKAATYEPTPPWSGEL